MTLDVTPAETVMLRALVELHIKSLSQQIANGELTVTGREQYLRDIVDSQRLIVKLQAAATTCMRLPEFGG